jgi:DnaJ-class molecular chaperone
MRDLHRLRERHWSPERIIEEGRIGIDFWEHHEADPYAVLSLMPGASLEEAAAARRRIAQQCHPDRLDDEGDRDEAMRRMVAANAAYDRLRRALRAV